MSKPKKTLGQRLAMAAASTLGGTIVAVIFWLLGFEEAALFVLFLIPFGFLMALAGFFD